ncbi:MAG: cation:proton antiporter [delta proteobacterium MLS_D]|jgi:multicomponent Na+:H+ antiporter subunit G|nr:MAG: cation:proton antiporter [delta proteobacterium MLS_D]
MTEIQNLVTIILVTLGTFFMFVGSWGIVRLPDFYSRSHAVSLSDTLGILLILGGLMVYEGFTINSAKIFIALIFMAHASPTGSHAIARAAFRGGLKPLFTRTENREQ